MRARFVAVAACLALPLMSTAAQAKPELQMSIVAEKDVTVTKGGKKTVKRVPAQTSAPGEVLIYTLSYKNVGDEKATAVNVDNPLPNGMKYQPESAVGAGAQVSFSVDGGKTFASAEQLAKSSKKKAEDYTTIRWVIGEVKPGQAGQLGFRAQVE